MTKDRLLHVYFAFIIKHLKCYSKSAIANGCRKLLFSSAKPLDPFAASSSGNPQKSFGDSIKVMKKFMSTRSLSFDSFLRDGALHRHHF